MSPDGGIVFMTGNPIIPVTPWDGGTPLEPDMFAYRIIDPNDGNLHDQCQDVFSFAVPGNLSGTYQMFTIAGPASEPLSLFNALTPLGSKAVTFN